MLQPGAAKWHSPSGVDTTWFTCLEGGCGHLDVETVISFGAVIV